MLDCGAQEDVRRSEARSKKLALKHGWDGKSWGVSSQTMYSMVIELLGHKPKLDPVPVKTKMTVTEYANLPHPFGNALVLSTGHVMPMVKQHYQQHQRSQQRTRYGGHVLGLTV
jgi:hypothetical protein